MMTLMSLTDLNRIRLSNMLVLFGAALIVFIYIVPYGFEIKYEDLIYFKGVLFGTGICFMGFALRIDGYVRDLLISLGIGQLTLFYMSVLNLFYDALIETRLLYLITLIIIGSTMLVLIMIRFWLNRIIKLCLNTIERILIVKSWLDNVLALLIKLIRLWLRRILAWLRR